MRPKLSERLLTIPQVADILGFGYDRTRKWLESYDALIVIGDRRYTTAEILRDRFPEVYREVVKDTWDDEDLDDL